MLTLGAQYDPGQWFVMAELMMLDNRREGTVMRTVSPLRPGKLVNIASTRFGTSVPSSSVCERAIARPSNSGALSTRINEDNISGMREGSITCSEQFGI